MRRLFVPRGRLPEPGGRVELEARELHYLRDVLRLRPGAELELFDGEGGRHAARLAGEAEAPWLEAGPRAARAARAVEVALAFALARGERCDFIVQKATELGVARLLPFAAERSVVKLEGARAAERVRRWARIAEEAARQCGRDEVPGVEPIAPLAARLAGLPPAHRLLLFYEGGGAPLATVLEPGAPGQVLLIGPEGGFAPAEVRACLDAGAQAVTLGPRVLRVDTAALAALTLVQAGLGELG